MPLYLFQGRYAPAAIKAMIEDPQDRKIAASAMVEAVGGKLLDMYFCFGSDDFIAIIEAPDDKAMAAGSMLVGSSGAFSGGSTTKLMTTADAKEAMRLAQDAASSYTSPLG